jgi:hypothetical protein
MAPELRQRSWENRSNFTTADKIGIALYIGNETWEESGTFHHRDWFNPAVEPSESIWTTVLNAVLFQIEEVSLTNDVFETTVNWHAMGSSQTQFGGDQYEAVYPNTAEGYPAWGVG